MSGLEFALAVLAVAFALGLVRAVRGPSVADRALGADLGFYVVVAGVAILALRTGYAEFLDVVLIVTLLGFLATVALSVLVGRGQR
jgi:multicomponent Na+:H+ antiporter subunit F